VSVPVIEDKEGRERERECVCVGVQSVGVIDGKLVCVCMCVGGVQ
jgi:hypothetical protein